MDKKLIYNSNDLKIYHTVLGLLSNNVYLIESDGTKALVDPSCRADDIMDFIDNHTDYILFTHYHFDHIGAAKEIKDKNGAKTYASRIDAPYIDQSEEIPTFHRRVEACEVDVRLKENDIVSVGKTNWRIIETPGHSMGSICYYEENHKLLLSGDTLFCGSYGRVDFVDSSPKAMIESLNKLSKLPKDTKVFPGHNEFTSIGDELTFIDQLRL